MSPTHSTYAKEIVRVCRLLADGGLVAAMDGNVSIRINARTVAITRSGKRKRDIRSTDIVFLPLDGQKKKTRLQPSSELPTHLSLYNADSSIRAIVHAHPPYATAFASSGTRLSPNVFPEAVLDLGDVPLVRYAMPSSKELGSLVARHAETSRAALLANHGAIAWGPTLDVAFQRMEKLEHIAQIEFYARLLGGVRQLNPEQVSLLHSKHPLSAVSRV
jgi:L-fuculose-phosphate aldolase